MLISRVVDGNDLGAAGGGRNALLGADLGRVEAAAGALLAVPPTARRHLSAMGAGFFDANRKELFDRRGSATFGAILEDDEDACAVGAGTELVATEAGLVHVVECRIRGEMKT